MRIAWRHAPSSVAALNPDYYLFMFYQLHSMRHLIHTRTNTHTRTRTHAHKHARTDTQTHTHLRAHTLTHTHMTRLTSLTMVTDM